MKRFIIPILLMIGLATANRLYAQLPVELIDRNGAISLSFNKPNFTQESHRTFLSSVLTLSGHQDITPAFSLLFSIPYVNIGFKETIGFRINSSNIMGNPKIGFAVQAPTSPISLNMGLRFPIVENVNRSNISAVFFGSVTQFVEDLEAYTADHMPVEANVVFFQKGVNGPFARLSGGAAFWIPTEDFAEKELYFLYSLGSGIISRSYTVYGEFTGRFLATNDNEPDTNFNQIKFAGAFGSGKIRPGVKFLLYVDDELSNLVDFVAGISLTLVSGK